MIALLLSETQYIKTVHGSVYMIPTWPFPGTRVNQLKVQRYNFVHVILGWRLYNIFLLLMKGL